MVPIDLNDNTMEILKKKISLFIKYWKYLILCVFRLFPNESVIIVTALIHGTKNYEMEWKRILVEWIDPSNE